MEFPLEELKNYQTMLSEASEKEAKEILIALKSIPVAYSQLKKTKIGSTIKMIGKKYPSLQLKAKQLTQKWKALIPVKLSKKALEALGIRRERSLESLINSVGDREIAEKIEAVMNLSLDEVKYQQKTRAIRSNLQRNHALRSKVLSGEISPEDLVSMGPYEMATPEMQLEREKITKDFMDSRRNDWPLANNRNIGSIYKCHKCKSDRTVMHQMQTRSADEPMTT